ncbi:MAG: AAA family ATPase [Thermoguttaceae bacterium]|nr:AAA family ATPase [Thermoguttaceae bacterium]
MIIQSLYVDRFGKWKGLKLKNLQTGVNLFYGPNEAGKTTLMQFLRTIFYGFSEDRLVYAFRDEPEQTGGEIQVQTPFGLLSVARHLTALPEFETENSRQNSQTGKGRSRLVSQLENAEIPFYALDSFRNRYKTRNLEDGLIITNERGSRQDVNQWRKLLDLTDGADAGSGMVGRTLENDETLYNNIFAMGLQELQRLSVLNSTEASKRLYDLSTGLTRYSSARILAELIRTRQRILGENAFPEPLKTEDLQWCDDFSTPVFLRESAGFQRIPPYEITSLLNYSQILQKQQKNIQTQNKKYGKINSEKTALSENIRKLEDEIQQQKHKIHILEIARDVQETWNQRADLDSQIIAFGEQNPDLIEVSDREIEHLNENLKKLGKIHQEVQTIKENRSQFQSVLETLNTKFAGIPLNAELLQSVPAIESFSQQQDWIENLRGRLEDLHRQRLDSEAQLSIDYRRLGLALPDFDQVSTSEKAFPYDVRTLRPLRSPIREIHRMQRQIQTTKKHRQELLHEADENGQKIGAYFDACRTRVDRFPQIRQLAGMERFPEIFLQPTRKETASPASPRINALKTMNFSIADEIPPEILAPESVQKKIQDETGLDAEKPASQIDVNALSALLGEVLANLRRKEMHVTQLSTTLKKLAPLEKERAETLKKRLLPQRELYALGTAFIFGLALALFGFLRLTGFLASASSGGSAVLMNLFLMVSGFALSVASIAFRVVFSQKTERKITELEDELSAALQQRGRLIRLGFGSREDEIMGLSDAEILDHCSHETEKVSDQTAFLEKEIAEAENAGINASKRSALLLEAKYDGGRLRKLSHGFRQAKERRTEVLKSLNLPENWKASNIRLLMDASDRIHELWRRRNRDIEDFQLYENELKLLVERLRKLLPVFGPNFEQEMQGGDSRFPFAPGIFAEMQTRIQKEREREQGRKSLEQKIHSNRLGIRKLKSEFRKKAQIRAQLLENSGVEDEKGLKRKLESLNQLKELREKRRELQKEIDSVVQFACTESMLWEVYENNSPEQIEEKRKILLNSLAENEFQLASAQKRSAECEAILEKIISDDSPMRIQYELMKTQAQIGHAVNSWRILALTQRLIETIQRTYRLKRQPKTLECASGFLQEMTEGKYSRVWTPVDEDILFVQRSDGTVFSTEQLSMGTRELLYLAIRLALIDEYRRRNIFLPIILDDVLVNFDRVRAVAAAKVLTHFAGDQTQIFFFTSHEHIREIFEQENAVICDMGK